eukprot:TRINITY_DN303_c3_g1_i2.p1 TRINITY_DN303_c3_g1~~TRINITY_DN303_c3_g1_i2.p1  ORF type:complete len:361 (-),score=65.73 TRINITY_DN303_c3_g1_i2:400-1404(-)
MAGKDMSNVAVTAAACACALVGGLYVAKLVASSGSAGGCHREVPARRPARRGGSSRRRYVEVDPDSSSEEYAAPVAASARRAKASKTRLDDEPMVAGWQGFSMQEARELADAGQERAMATTPQEVLANLQKGNMRFWSGTAVRPEKSAFERRALISKQFPTVAVLGCADSRVPVEIVFDAGLGDVFVIRVAGNCLDTASLASLQYAVNHLKVKVLMVMGHEGCGAVKAAGLPLDKIEQEPQALSRLLKNLKRGLDNGRSEAIQDARAHDREKVILNVKQQLGFLMHDEGIVSKVREGELLCVGAMYEISSGIVDFFSELSSSTVDAAIKAKRVC